ncbi:protein kinase, partial [Salmonella enterica subsp. enterica serovar 1,4,[5],12:i:-]
IGRFTLLKVLGEGGFGTVYQAKDTALDRMVALKVIRASKLGSIQMEARLVREAKAASLLNHAGIVKVFDLVENGPFKVLI